MNNHWQKGVGILTSIYVSRMLGMFMVFPVFSLYALDLDHATPALAGIALGMYGLSQGLLQIPFGQVSDKFGRKPVIAFGLILFFIGSLIAAVADNIYVMIIGRAVQGMGAVSAVTLAYATDITPIDKRGKVMAIIGGSIGMTFVLSLIIGPVIAAWIGVDGLFYLIAALALLALFATFALPKATSNTTDSHSGRYDKQALWQASSAILLTHTLFTATFVVLPTSLVNLNLDKAVHWWLYLPANLIALGFMRYKAVPHPLNFGLSFIVLAIGLGLIAMGSSLWLMALAICIFFIAFYRLETGLPHWVANLADPNARGKAMGIFSTMQFLGSFVGGVLGGWLWQHTSDATVFTILLLGAALSGIALLYLGKRDTLSL